MLNLTCKVIRHENFTQRLDIKTNKIIFINDLALMKMDIDGLPSRKNLMPICLPGPHVNMTKTCWITGFGDDSINNSMSFAY